MQLSHFVSTLSCLLAIAAVPSLAAPAPAPKAMPVPVAMPSAVARLLERAPEAAPAPTPGPDISELEKRGKSYKINDPSCTCLFSQGRSISCNWGGKWTTCDIQDNGASQCRTWWSNGYGQASCPSWCPQPRPPKKA